MFHVKHSFLFPILIYIWKEDNDEDPLSFSLRKIKMFHVKQLMDGNYDKSSIV